MFKVINMNKATHSLAKANIGSIQLMTGKRNIMNMITLKKIP